MSPEIAPPETPVPPEGQKAAEQLLGLAEDVKFEDALEQKSKGEFSDAELAKRQSVFQEHGLDLDPHVGPQRLDFLEEDWTIARSSETPLISLYAADSYRLEAAQAHPRPSRPYDSVYAEARLRSLPLIHGTSVEGFLSLVSQDSFASNKGLFKESGQDALSFSEARKGATNLGDRELGLDQYVFADFGRPHRFHQQGEVTLVIDPSAMEQPGVFMTEKDVADCKDLDEYMRGATTTDYFYDKAGMRISRGRVSSREVRENGAYRSQTVYNTVDKFASGQDSDPNTLGEPDFSTWEVKLPEVPIEAIRRVIVRDKETFDRLQAELGDRFDLVLEPELKPGNFGALEIPGEFERQYAQMIDADYQARAEKMAMLSDDEKEQVVVVFPQTDPDEDGITKIVTRHTNPVLYPGQVETYSSEQELSDDIHETAANLDPNSLFTQSKHGKRLWFRDRSGKTGLGTPSKSCVVAVFERSKKQPEIGQIVKLETLTPSDS